MFVKLVTAFPQMDK